MGGLQIPRWWRGPPTQAAFICMYGFLGLADDYVTAKQTLQNPINPHTHPKLLGPALGGLQNPDPLMVGNTSRPPMGWWLPPWSFGLDSQTRGTRENRRTALKYRVPHGSHSHTSLFPLSLSFDASDATMQSHWSVRG
jgi:hypothetical protein